MVQRTQTKSITIQWILLILVLFFCTLSHRQRDCLEMEQGEESLSTITLHHRRKNHLFGSVTLCYNVCSAVGSNFRQKCSQLYCSEPAAESRMASSKATIPPTPCLDN